MARVCVQHQLLTWQVVQHLIERRQHMYADDDAEQRWVCARDHRSACDVAFMLRAEDEGECDRFSQRCAACGPPRRRASARAVRFHQYAYVQLYSSTLAPLSTSMCAKRSHH